MDMAMQLLADQAYTRVQHSQLQTAVWERKSHLHLGEKIKQATRENQPYRHMVNNHTSIWGEKVTHLGEKIKHAPGE